MKMNPSLFIIFNVAGVGLFVSGIVQVSAADGNKLLVFLLDGFRWDYLETFFQPNELPGFSKLLDNGIRAKALKPDFPSISFANYYSIMTGLHAETHGMIHNYMYDPTTRKYFLIGNNPDQFLPIWWNDGEPLWVTAKKQGKESYWWYWSGCEVEIRETRPKFCQPWSAAPHPSFQNFSDAIDAAIEVLRNGSAELAGVYNGQVDWWGHKVGPVDGNISKIIRLVDEQLVHLFDALETKRFSADGGKLSDRVNVMIFSDHGMTRLTDPSSGIIRFNMSLVGPDDIVIGSTFGPVLQVYTSEDRVNDTYDRLKNMHPNVTVYRKRDIPDRYFFKTHYRIPPLLLVADLGYAIGYKSNTTNTDAGFHGYDNDFSDMHGIFLATGPDFKKKLRTDTLRAVDLYQVMCHVLDIEPSPHNGTWQNVAGILTPRSSSAARLETQLSTFRLLMLIVMVVTLAAINGKM